MRREGMQMPGASKTGKTTRSKTGTTAKKRVSKAQKKQIMQRRRMILAGAAAALVLLWFARMAWYPITGGQLRDFGWQGDTSFGEVWQLNHLLRKYKITSRPSLTMFFATAASESGKGRLTLEEGGADYYAAHGYSTNDRGAGYLQLTHRSEQLAFLQAMGDDFDGADTASYIAERYPWESACWEWSVGKTAPDPNPNTYAKKRGNTVEVFLATQYAINGWTISDDALGKIVQGAEYTVSADGTSITVGDETAPAPKNWPDRLAYYQQALEIWG